MVGIAEAIVAVGHCLLVVIPGGKGLMWLALTLTQPLPLLLPVPQCNDTTSLAALTARYNTCINAVLKFTMEKAVLTALCDLLKPWITHVAILKSRCVL